MRYFLSLSFFLLLLCVQVSAQNKPDTTLKDDKIPEYEDVAPVFKGGFAEWAKYVEKTLIYPPSAVTNGIEGTVYIKTVVDTTGRLTDIQIVKGVEGLNEEALRVVKNSPNWIPGMHKGKPVNVKMTIPIKFSLEGRKKKK